MNYFKELKVWQKAVEVVTQIYQMTNSFPREEQFGIISQIRRCSVSIPSNIAEGFERGGNQEFIQFLYVAKASCGEVRSQIYVAFDQGYMPKADFEESIVAFRRLSGMIGNLINYLRRSGMKGAKFSDSRKSD